MSLIRAYIENIIYYNKDNYYAVLDTSTDEGELVMVGTFPCITRGETIEAEGDFISHHVYGEQFSVSSFTVIPPEDTEAILRYLSGGAVRGIGPALAKRIVKAFKGDTFRIIEEEPERLAEIKGISEPMAMRIAEQVEEKKGMRDAVMFMQQYGIGAKLANRIYDRYGPVFYSILENNPFRLAEDIDGIGFRTADGIAEKMGIARDSEFRKRCGLLYCLSEAATNGHTWLPYGILKADAEQLLDTPLGDEYDGILSKLHLDGRVVVIGGQQGDYSGEGEDQVYLSAFYYTECEIAERLSALAIKGESSPVLTESRIRSIEKDNDISLDIRQREAVEASVDNGVLVITGGPGTGKTTTINALIGFYAKDDDTIALAAPTGRAAKRMTEATGCEAKTIHRLLEYTGMPEDANGPGTLSSYEGTDAGLGGAPYAGSGNAGGAGSTSGRGRFLRDERNPLEADVIIIDEVSMVDIFLMNALLKAIVPGTRLILVGDSDQLPSVGAGNVLKDIIASGCFMTVRLEHIFRQAALSDIVTNAHRINNGEPVDLTKNSGDFLFIGGRNAEGVISTIKKLITD